ncbi:protein FAM216A [Eleutherodactylus coqui]|uniref:protein FAM216A n=1 Tax=Eleutherodactylus coqui TaxID=57060 RepID=UPI0034633069
MERRTTCNDPRSKRKHIPEEKHIVRTSACSHKDLEEGAHEDVISKDPQKGCRLQIKTIKIPRAMKKEAFLQHPDLTMGQKRYLCSIARIYSTSNMRALTAKHWHSRITWFKESSSESSIFKKKQE